MHRKEKLLKMNVIKRDGRIVVFNKAKIVTAISNAFKEVDLEITDKALDKATEIAESIEKINKDLAVEEIQDLVEQKLMSSSRKDVAKAYILFRNNRTNERNKRSKLTKSITRRLKASDVENQNANVDEKSFGGKMGAVTSDVLKDYALNNCMSRKSKMNHLNNEIYIHDLDSYAAGMHNCLTVPFDDLLSKGFNTRQVDIRPANSINTAFQLVAVIFQLQSLMQFGGVSASHLDWTMIPYVRKSFRKHYSDAIHYIKTDNWKVVVPKEDWSIDSEDYKVVPEWYEYAIEMTTKELKQAVEALFHNLNSLQSRSGNQLPFTSINFGTCTIPEGRMVIKALLEGSIKGVGKFHRTPIFPCSIFQCMKGVNRKPGEPNYDLFQLALKSTAQRLYPNYANVDWSGNEGYDKNDPRTFFSTMGKCKSAHVKHPQTNSLLGVA